MRPSRRTRSRRIGFRCAGLVLGLATAFPALATTWFPITVDDPVGDRKCDVLGWGSYGSYIYQWPEKYDQVFWPFTDPNAIWLCPSGFAAYIEDTTLSEAEKRRILDYLASAPRLNPKRAEPRERLLRLEAIYRLRDLDARARLRVLRALAYLHEQQQDAAKAAELRAEALTLIDAQLADTALDARVRMEYLFVAMNYRRERGETAAADARLAELTSLIASAEPGDAAATDTDTDTDTDTEAEQRKGYAEYLKSLLPTAANIAPGGRLAPGG